MVRTDEGVAQSQFVVTMRRQNVVRRCLQVVRHPRSNKSNGTTLRAKLCLDISIVIGADTMTVMCSVADHGI